MTSRSWTSPVILLLGAALLVGCGGVDGTDPAAGSEAETIPLDGRGGGVLAYTHQPGTDAGLHEIHVMNADGTGSRRMIAASIGLNHQDWSPDAQQMAAVGYHGETWSIYRFDADGQNLLRLTTAAGVHDNEPAWSPDGTRIVFTRTYPTRDNRSEIWIMDFNGHGQHWIGVEGFAARWSPDGNRLILQSGVSEWSGVPSEILTCASDGSDVRTLTATPFNELSPAWSPDGSRIAFVADHEGDFDVYVMNADGTEPRRLTANEAADHVPRWSPDGSRIVFASDASGEGHWEVYVIGADGANLQRLTNTPAPATSISPVWRPDPR